MSMVGKKHNPYRRRPRPAHVARQLSGKAPLEKPATEKKAEPAPAPVLAPEPKSELVLEAPNIEAPVIKPVDPEPTESAEKEDSETGSKPKKRSRKKKAKKDEE